MNAPDVVSSAEAADVATELYRQIADSIPQMVWTARADGSLDYVNARVLEYTGQPKQSHYGWGWKSVVHPDDQENCVAVWTRSLQSGERYEVEYRLRRADGVWRWHHGSALPQRDAAGRILHWFGVCADIEDQVRSTQLLERMVEERTRALRDAQSRLAAIIENEPECVKVLDREGGLLEMNAAGLRMIEADGPQQVLGQSVYGVVAPEHRDAFRDLTERVCRGERGTLEFEIVGLKGTRRWMETHAVPFQDGASRETRLLGITRDVTERRRAERALQESERRFQHFMDNLPAPAWIRGPDYRYVWVNQAFTRLWGEWTGPVIGETAFRQFPQDEVKKYREIDEQVRAAGRPLQFVDHTRNGDWLKVKFPLADESGKVFIGGIALDITARVEAEEKARHYAGEVRVLLNRLVGAQEAERRRLADDLHDLIGQNLTALGIELAALRRLLPAQSAGAAGARLDAMAGLVNDTVESIRGVMAELRPAALAEFGLVPALRAHAAAFAERTGIKVSTSVPNALPRLPAEAELALFRIAQEALTNAAKHSGGTSVDVSVLEVGGALRLMVQDDGRGFDDPVGARSARRGGYGLPEMRERAEAHGGRLRIEFPGRGTRLLVDLPLQDGH